jgi:hypothetical protein
MVRLRVCPCFRLSEHGEFMEPVANRPWDAWHVVNDGKRFIINYVSDGFYYCCLLFNAFTQQAYMPKVCGHQL